MTQPRRDSIVSGLGPKERPIHQFPNNAIKFY